MNRMHTTAGIMFLIFSILAAPVQAQSTFAERLALTGKVWGYLKYHHTGTCQSSLPDQWPGYPGEREEQRNDFWDNVLLDNLAAQSPQDSDATFNEHLTTLIAAAGVNEPSNNMLPPVEENYRIPSSKAWMDDPLMSGQNRQSIDQLADEYRPFSNCHAGTTYFGHPDFSKDKSYYYLGDESQRAGGQMLGLFRFWNIVNYFSPYKALIDKDWEAVLDLYVARMIDVSDITGYHLLMRQFVIEVGDSHTGLGSTYINDYLGPKYLPARLELVEGKTIVTGALEGVALQPGDEVLSIDGQDVGALRNYYSSYVRASNPVTTANHISISLMRTHNETVELEVRRNGQIHFVTASVPGPFPQSLYALPGSAWERNEFADCAIGYVDMGELEVSDIPAMMRQFDDTDGIVFDIRAYPNGTLWPLVDYLFPGPIDIALFHLPRMHYPGTTVPFIETIGSGAEDPYGGRVILLFNENTISQAEYTVMGLEQHPGAVKIGSQTQAADGNVSEVWLPGGIKSYLTMLGVYYPDGTPTQRIGIVPDVYVTPTIEGIRNGVDEVLEVALDCDHVLDPEWPPEIRPESGPYYDPARSGHGFDLSWVGDTLVLANYTFRQDGSPVWYLGTGGMQEGVFELDEGSYTAYSYDHVEGSTTEHPIESVDFTLDFKAGQQQIECAIENPSSRLFPASLDWHQGDARVRWCPELLTAGNEEPLRDIGGMWYGGEADSGWGITARMWGQALFIVVFYYDQSGQPTWAIASGDVSPDWPQSGPASFELLEPRGFCLTCAPAPIETRVIGTIEISLMNGSRTFQEDNWVSIEALPGDDEAPWLRDHIPLAILSDP